MSRILSESNINYVEQFIEINKCSDNLTGISEYYREQTIKDWETINDKNTQCTTYLQFADNSYGMISYGFYKTKKEEIYIISAYCNKLTNYYNVDDNWYMLQ
jgi:hypothetical protein